MVLTALAAVHFHVQCLNSIGLPSIFAALIWHMIIATQSAAGQTMWNVSQDAFLLRVTEEEIKAR